MTKGYTAIKCRGEILMMEILIQKSPASDRDAVFNVMGWIRFSVEACPQRRQKRQVLRSGKEADNQATKQTQKWSKRWELNSDEN